MNKREEKGMNSFVIVVSGLPRSGTSMMMRMLEAGGVPIVTDNTRRADEDNPKGYYEDERVKKLKDDNLWLEESKGKAIKIVSVLLYDLPRTAEYKIIFMQRDVDEILSSQKKMLQRRKEDTDSIDDTIMAKKFQKHLREIRDWLGEQSNIECLYVNYRDAILDPLNISKRVATFLDKDLDASALAQGVDHKLYRNKKI
jgi:hypothetical protein